MADQEKRPLLDERIEALVHSGELFQGELRDLGEKMDKISSKVDKLAEVSSRHEREIQRFRRAMRAALEAWLNEGEDEESGNTTA